MKKILALGLCICMTAAVSACGSGQGQTAAGTVPAQAAVEKTAEGSGGETGTPDGNTEGAGAAGETGAGDSRSAEMDAPVQTEPLLVYLNDFDGVIGDLFKEATGYDVEVVAGNGAETMSRIEAEKSNPQWDVVWIDSMYDVYNLSGDGSLLTGWEPENAANLTEFSKGLVPDNKCCWPTDIHAAGVLVYRTDKYDQSSAPRTFADLTDEVYAGQVGMADPGVAAPAYPLAAYFFDRLGMDGGKAYFNQLFNQGLKVYPKNPQVVQALASGEVSIALLQETNAYDMVAGGEPIQILWPEEGAPGSTRVAAINAGSDQMEIAKLFVNFLLDPATQQKLVDTGDEGYFEPSVNGVNRKAERDENAKMAVADIEWGAKNEAEIKAWFADMSAQ